MFVSDIIEDAADVVGVSRTSPQVYKLLNKAITLLSNVRTESGTPCWIPQLAYVDVVVTDRTLVLPEIVDTVLKVNIHTKPSFSRGRLFEFTMNTPGSNDEELLYAWEDRGEQPVQLQPPVASSIVAVRESSEDIDKKIVIVAMVNGQQKTEELTLVSGEPIPTNFSTTEIISVRKERTVGSVELRTTDGDILLATYLPNVTHPNFRTIRLSKDAGAVRALVKRKTYKVAEETDFIPLPDEMALVNAIKAIHFQMTDRYDLATAAETAAVKQIREAHAAKQLFEEIAGATEMDRPRQVNWGTREVVLVGEVYADAAETFGPIGEANLFDRIGQAVDVLSAECLWDSQIGYADISTETFVRDQPYFALPRRVGAVLALNRGCVPGPARNKWAEFHINGDGKFDDVGGPRGGWTDMGVVITVNRIKSSCQIVAVPLDAGDNNTVIRVWAYDDEERPIYHAGNPYITVPCVYGSLTPVPGLPDIKRIERITKAESDGYVALWALDDAGGQDYLLGYYEPDELEPSYRQIAVPKGTGTIRIRYRARTKVISSLLDFINLPDRFAVVQAMRYLAKSRQDPVGAAPFLAQAVDLLKKIERQLNPGRQHAPQVDGNVCGPGGGEYVT